jgi:hypothetical protein
MTVAGDLRVTGDLYVSPDSIYLGALQLSSSSGNLVVHGNVTANNVTTTGNVSANYFLGNGALLTGITVGGGSYSNVQVATYLPTYSGNVANVRLGTSGVLTFADGTTQTTAATGGGSNYGNANVATYLPTYSGNITAASMNVSGNVLANVITVGGIRGTVFGATKLSTVTLGATINNYVEFLTVSGGLNGGYNLMISINNNLAGTNIQTNKVYIVSGNYGSYGTWQVAAPVSEQSSAGQSGAWELLITETAGDIVFRLRNKIGFVGTSTNSINIYNLDANNTLTLTQSATTGTDATVYNLSGGSPLMIIGANTQTGTGQVAVATPYATNGSTFTVNGNAYVSGNITTNSSFVGNIVGTTAAFTNGNVGGYAIGYRDVPQITVANLTLIASDAGKHYYGANTNPTTITIPLNSSVEFGNGTAISIVNQGTGNITVANAAGVLLYLAGNSTAGSRTLTSYGMATLIKVQVNTWFINGSGVV